MNRRTVELAVLVMFFSVKQNSDKNAAWLYSYCLRFETKIFTGMFVQHSRLLHLRTDGTQRHLCSMFLGLLITCAWFSVNLFCKFKSFTNSNVRNVIHCAS